MQKNVARHGAAGLHVLIFCLLVAFLHEGCRNPASDDLLPEGKDGSHTVSSAGTIVNEYAALAQDASSGTTSITVDSLTALTHDAAPLVSGDLLLVTQMQGATLATPDNPSFGGVAALGSAGLFEFVKVAGVEVATNSVSLRAPLINSYSAAGAVQVVRVPQYTTLTVGVGGSISAPMWNGAIGGVVALTATRTVTLNGRIDVSGRGFRGGPADNDSSADSSVAYMQYRYSASSDGARKGESIGGFLVTYGRGAPANGGGGGNANNAGGGGGANGRSSDTWTGQGVFDTTVVGATAWMFDPGYISNGNTYATSEGGGRGGYSYSNSNQNALITGPGNAAWAGNYRREVGGLGGRPLDNDPASRLFFGGGGGAGDGNNSHAGAGGNGGGIVIIIAPEVQGTGGEVLANGDAGQSADSSSGSATGDAAGGGGGGGTVVIQAASIQGISIQARGGDGGSQTVNNEQEAEGPGGGGGGGYVAISAAATMDVSGGQSGTTTSPAVSEFPVNGASRGGDGQTFTSSTISVPGFYLP